MMERIISIRLVIFMLCISYVYMKIIIMLLSNMYNSLLKFIGWKLGLELMFFIIL